MDVGVAVDGDLRELFHTGYLWVRKDPESGEVEIRLAEHVRAAVAAMVEQAGIAGE